MPCVFSWTNDDGSVDVVQLDVYDSETHGMATEVSDFPVEDGPNISDNVRRKPKTLTIEGYVSDTPLPENHGSGTNGGTHVANLGLVGLSTPGTATYHNALRALNVPDSPLRANAAALVSAGFNALAGALGFGPGAPQVNARVLEPRKADSPQVNAWSWPNFSSRVAETFNLLEKAYDNAVLMRVVTDYKTYTGMVFADNGLQVPRKTDDGNGAPFTLDLKQIRIVNSQTVTAPKPAEPSGQLKKSAGSKTTKEGPTDADKRALRFSVAAQLTGVKGANA